MSIFLAKLNKKYKNISLPVRASFWYLFASVMQKGIAFLTTPIFTRALSQTDYGSFSLFQTWFDFIIIFTSLNLSGGVFNNGMTKFEDDRNHFVTSMFGLSSVITLIFFVLYLMFSSSINKITGFETCIMEIMFLQLLFEPAYLLWAAKQRYTYNYRPLIVASIFIGVVNPIVSVIVVLNASNRLYARIFSYVGVLLIAYIVVTISILRKDRKLVDRDYWKYALLFNVPLIPHYLSFFVLNLSDRIMIEKYCGKEQVALYSVAYSVAMIFNVIVNAINNTYIPYIYQKIKANKISELRKTTSTLILFVGILCFIPILIGPEVVAIMGDSSYHDSIWVIPPITASVFLIFLYNLFGTVEFYFEKSKFVATASCCGAFMNVVLNFIFIPLFGFVAAGYTTLFCYLIFVIAHYVFYKHVIKCNGINSIFDVKFIFKFLFVFLAAVFVCVFVYPYIMIRYALILLVCLSAFLKRNEIKNILNTLKNK